MKALTIKQPWASLIVQGIKDVENRSWKTNFRGRIYIHCSAPKKFKVHFTDQQIISAMPILRILSAGDLPFGSIIGEVDIVDCLMNHESIWAEKDCYNWVLANPIMYDKPINNVKGALSFWNYEPKPIY